MRRILLILGLLLLPQIAGAEALSLWVQGVLDRADAGLAAVPSASGGCDTEGTIQEIRNNLSAIRDRRSILLNEGIESQFLREKNLCIESDRILLQNKLTEVYDAFEVATATCNLRASSVLRTVYEFTVDAYVSFIRGSVDASFQDNRLRRINPFLSTEIDPDSLEPLCPYTTNYGPHFIGAVPGASQNSFDRKSYGCDREVLSQIRDSLPPDLQTEADDLIDFMDRSGTLASDIYTIVRQAIFNIDSTIALITGRTPPTSPSGSVSPPPHEEREGCLRPPSPENGTAADFDAVLAAFPDYFSPENILNPESSTATFNPPPDRMLPIGTLFRPSYDTFFTLPNALILSRAHADRKGEIGYDRPIVDELDHKEEEQQFVFMYKTNLTDDLRRTGADSERFISMSDAILRDSYERNLDSVASLYSAVQALTSVTETFLPKEYIPQLVYFLRRSCVDGHCNSILDAVAKRSFNPYCHPFVSGKYTDERASDKCFCTPEFDGEEYCLGGQLHLDTQPPPELQCGEPRSSPSASFQSSIGGGFFRF